jgi:hypothetical protein
MRHHTNLVVLPRIRSIPALANKTFVAPSQRDTAGKLPVPPYVVIYPSDGVDTRERLTGPQTAQHPRYTLHIVGSSYDNAATVAELIKAKFVVNGVGIQADVEGEHSYGMTYGSPQPIQVDYDTSPALVYATAEISWDADPTPA